MIFCIKNLEEYMNISIFREQIRKGRICDCLSGQKHHNINVDKQPGTGMHGSWLNVKQ